MADRYVVVVTIDHLCCERRRLVANIALRMSNTNARFSPSSASLLVEH